MLDSIARTTQPFTGEEYLESIRDRAGSSSTASEWRM